MKKVIKLTEKDITKLVQRVIEEQEMEEGILDPVRNVAQGLKGVWRGEGYEYYNFMSALSNIIRDLKRADRPNHKLMDDLLKLKGKVIASKMNTAKRDQLERYIDEAEKYFNLYQTSIEGIQAVLNTYLK